MFVVTWNTSCCSYDLPECLSMDKVRFPLRPQINSGPKSEKPLSKTKRLLSVRPTGRFSNHFIDDLKLLVALCA